MAVRMNYGRSVKGQRGFGALEVMIALIIATLTIVAGARVLRTYMDRQANLSASSQMVLVATAANNYIKDNYANIVAIATPSSTAVITVPMLVSTGYLPNGFIGTNAYGQSYLILALEPTANNLQTLIITQNGDVIKDMYLFEISKQIGARGGYIPSTNTANAIGSFGGWQTGLAQYGVAPGGGHLAAALFFDNGAVVNDYLYRSAVPGHPELNRMNTNIDLAGHDLNNVGTTNTTTANVAGNATINGSVNVGGNSTVNGTSTVGSNLIVNGSTSVGGTSIVNGDSTVNSSLVVGANSSVGGDSYTGGWFRTRGDTGWYSEKWGGGWYMSDPDWVRAYGDKNVTTGGQMQAGTLVSGGRTTVGEYLQVNGLASAGGGCAPNGLVGRDPNGQPLACQGGVWTAGGIGTIQYRVVTAATAALSNCAPDEKLVGGGGYCIATSDGRLKSNTPQGNGWNTACPGNMTTAIAICVR